jgi:hypothetical protein
MFKKAYFMPYLSFFEARVDMPQSLLFMAGFAAALLFAASIVLLYGIAQSGISAGKTAGRGWRIGAVVSILVIALVLGFPFMPGAGSGIPVLAGSVVQFAGFWLSRSFFRSCC